MTGLSRRIAKVAGSNLAFVFLRVFAISTNASSFYFYEYVSFSCFFEYFYDSFYHEIHQ